MHRHAKSQECQQIVPCGNSRDVCRRVCRRASFSLLGVRPRGQQGGADATGRLSACRDRRLRRPGPLGVAERQPRQPSCPRRRHHRPQPSGRRDDRARRR